eukprot:jgi/Bigna1/90184/estExt_fgenesh1_pg.C_640076
MASTSSASLPKRVPYLCLQADYSISIANAIVKSLGGSSGKEKTASPSCSTSQKSKNHEEATTTNGDVKETARGRTESEDIKQILIKAKTAPPPLSTDIWVSAHIFEKFQAFGAVNIVASASTSEDAATPDKCCYDIKAEAKEGKFRVDFVPNKALSQELLSSSSNQIKAKVTCEESGMTIEHIFASPDIEWDAASSKPMSQEKQRQNLATRRNRAAAQTALYSVDVSPFRDLLAVSGNDGFIR